MNCDENQHFLQEDQSTTKLELHGVCVCFGAGRKQNGPICTQKLHGETTLASENRAKKKVSGKRNPFPRRLA